MVGTKELVRSELDDDSVDFVFSLTAGRKSDTTSLQYYSQSFDQAFILRDLAYSTRAGTYCRVDEATTKYAAR